MNLSFKAKTQDKQLLSKHNKHLYFYLNLGVPCPFLPDQSSNPGGHFVSVQELHIIKTSHCCSFNLCRAAGLNSTPSCRLSLGVKPAGSLPQLCTVYVEYSNNCLQKHLVTKQIYIFCDLDEKLCAQSSVLSYSSIFYTLHMYVQRCGLISPVVFIRGNTILTPDSCIACLSHCHIFR